MVRKLLLASSMLVVCPATAQTRPSQDGPDASTDQPQDPGDIVVTAKAGAFREQRIIDTPKTVISIGSNLIKDLQPTTILDATKYVAALTPRSSPTDGSLRFYIRGLDLAELTTRDGLYFPDAFVSRSDIERIEVLAGIPDITQGGIVVPGGLVNFVPKRPVSNDFAEATTGIDNAASAYGTADVNVMRSDRTLGLRMNVEERLVRRTFGHARGNDTGLALAGLAKLMPNITLEANLSYRRYAPDRDDGGTYPSFDGTRIPDVHHYRWYGQDWNRLRQTRLLGELKLSGTFDGGWAFTLKGHAMNYRIESTSVSYDPSDAAEAAGSGFRQANAYRYSQYYRHTHAASGVVTKTVEFGAVRNVIALVADETRVPQLNASASASGPLVDLNGTSAAFQVARPQFGDYPSLVPGYYLMQTDYGIGDELTLFERLTISGNVRRYHYKGQSYDANGTPQYPATQVDQWLPSAALLFKIRPNLSVYTTYGRAAEDGGTASIQTAINFGDPLGPVKSKAIEAGIKADVLGGVFTVAAFRIDRPSETLQNGIDALTGNTRYRGVDANLQFRIADRMTLIASGEYLDARVQDAADAAIIGKRPQNVPEYSASAYASYDLSDAFALNGGFQYVGDKAVYDDNSVFAPSYFLVDLGARSSFAVGDHRLDVRLKLTNITDRYYYISTKFGFPTGGQPRTATLSITTHF